MVYFCPSQLPGSGTEVGSHPERERERWMAEMEGGRDSQKKKKGRRRTQKKREKLMGYAGFIDPIPNTYL